MSPRMCILKKNFNILFKAVTMALVCLFIANSAVMAHSPDYSAAESSLAPEHGLKPFFDKMGLDFRKMANVMLSAGSLRGLIAAGNVRQRSIMDLNRLFPKGEVEIERELKSGELSCTGRTYRFVVFHFPSENRAIEARFVTDCDGLTEQESDELGVPALRGVWFIPALPRYGVGGARLNDPAFKDNTDNPDYDAHGKIENTKVWLATDKDGFSFDRFHAIHIKPYWRYLTKRVGVDKPKHFKGMDGLVVSIVRDYADRELYLEFRPHYPGNILKGSSDVFHRFTLGRDRLLMPVNGDNKTHPQSISINKEVERRGYTKVISVSPGALVIFAGGGNNGSYHMDALYTRLSRYFEYSGQKAPGLIVTKKTVRNGGPSFLRLEVRKASHYADPDKDPGKEVFARLDIDPGTFRPIGTKKAWDAGGISFLDAMLEQRPGSMDQYSDTRRRNMHHDGKIIQVGKKSVGFHNIVYTEVDTYCNYLINKTHFLMGGETLKALDFTAKSGWIEITAVIERYDRFVGKNVTENRFIDKIELEGDGRPKGVKCTEYGEGKFCVAIKSALLQQGRAEELVSFKGRPQLTIPGGRLFIDKSFCKSAELEPSRMVVFRYTGQAITKRIELRRIEEGTFYPKEIPLAVIYLDKDGYPMGMQKSNSEKRVHSTISDLLIKQAELIMKGQIAKSQLMPQRLDRDHKKPAIERSVQRKALRENTNDTFSIASMLYVNADTYMDFLEKKEGVKNIIKLRARLKESEGEKNRKAMSIELIPIVNGLAGEVEATDNIKEIRIDPRTTKPYGMGKSRKSCSILKILTLPEQGAQIDPGLYKSFVDSRRYPNKASATSKKASKPTVARAVLKDEKAPANKKTATAVKPGSESAFKPNVREAAPEGRLEMIMRIAKKLQYGPAMFVSTSGGRDEARELTDIEHTALHSAIRTMIGDFGMPPSTEFDASGVRRLSAGETAELAGTEDVTLNDGRTPSISIYILDDAALKAVLTGDSEYIATGLITHAGTWRSDPNGEARANLFMTRSVYDALKTLPEGSSLLARWREHEISHLNDRGADISPNAEEAAAALMIKVLAETGVIHAENLKLPTAVSDKKTIVCHVVANSILPTGQQGILNRLASEMRDEKYSEKLICLQVEDSASTEDFMTKLEDAKKQDWIKEYLGKGYDVRFDVACPRQDLVGMVQQSGMRALAFTKEGEGDVVQIEGIILALRALDEGSVSGLISVYKLITGKNVTAWTSDINELARMMLFVLPVRKVDINRIDELNRLIEENIKQAA